MHNLLGYAWWMPALRGAAGFIFGVLALALPGLTLTFLVALYAAYAIVGGARTISGAISHSRDTPGWWAPLLLGLCSLTAGVIPIVLPVMTALVLVLVAGVHAIATGVFDLIAASRLRGHARGASPLYLSSILSPVFSVLVLARPGAGARARTRLEDWSVCQFHRRIAASAQPQLAVLAPPRADGLPVHQMTGRPSCNSFHERS